MLEILFRAQDALTGKWVYGDLLHIGDTYYIIEPNDMEEDGHHIVQTTDSPLRVDSKTIGQFTGIKDNHDNKIFAGDIVECVSWNEYFSSPETGNVMEPFRRLMKIEFCRGGFKMVEKMPSFMKDNIWDMTTRYKDLTVIGNIYDNPDLIKEPIFTPADAIERINDILKQ